MRTLLTLFQLQSLSIDVLIQLLKKKIKLRGGDVHTFSHQIVPKKDPILLNPYKSFPWLHYDLEKDEVLCAACVSQEKKINLALSSKKEDAFVSTGCSN